MHLLPQPFSTRWVGLPPSPPVVRSLLARDRCRPPVAGSSSARTRAIVRRFDRPEFWPVHDRIRSSRIALTAGSGHSASAGEGAIHYWFRAPASTRRVAALDSSFREPRFCVDRSPQAPDLCRALASSVGRDCSLPFGGRRQLLIEQVRSLWVSRVRLGATPTAALHVACRVSPYFCCAKDPGPRT